MSDGNSQIEMETREDPRFVTFNTGDVIEGILLSIQPIQIKDKSAVRYIVREDSGEMVSFLGTFQINSRIHGTDRGRKVIIRCIGEDVMVKRGDNCMKVFEIQVSKKPVIKMPAPIPGLEITDDDIPF
jgi:hypothetical protein